MESTTFYFWADTPCSLARSKDGTTAADIYRVNDFVPADANQIERDGTAISEEEYRERIRREIVAHLPAKLGAPLPSVRIWAPDALKFPVDYSTMLTFARHREFLAAIFRSQGITTANITPPLPSFTFLPERDAPELSYELIFEKDVDHEVRGMLRDWIQDGLDVFGISMMPMSEQQLTFYTAKHRLTLV